MSAACHRQLRAVRADLTWTGVNKLDCQAGWQEPGVIKIQSMFSVITTFVHKYPSVFVLQSKIQVQFKKAFLGMEQLPIHDIQDMYIHIV